MRLQRSTQRLALLYLKQNGNQRLQQQQQRQQQHQCHYIPMTKGFIQRRHFASENAPSIDYVSKLREFYSLDEKNSLVVPIFKKALIYGNNTALRDNEGEYSYFHVFSNSKRLSRQIANLCGSGSSSTVGFFYVNNLLCTLTMWASWMCGQVVMPIDGSLTFEKQLELLKSAKIRLLIATTTHGTLASKLAYELEVPVLIIDHFFIQKPTDPFNYRREVFVGSKSVMIEGMLANDFYSTMDALLLPTVNVHGQPKLVVLSHRNLCAQLQSLTTVLQLTPDDRIMTVLSSTKQINGYLNVSLVPLSVGSTLHTFGEPFDAPRCWSTLLGINTQQKERPNILLAEPDVYKRLVAEYDKIFAKDNRMVEFIKNYCQKNFRLMLCNFGPMTKHLINRWHQITGQHLMNMFYMPETGIIFYDTNVQAKETLNIENFVMKAVMKRESTSPQVAATSPLTIWNAYRDIIPNVRVRIVDANNNVVLDKNGSENVEIINDNNSHRMTGKEECFEDIPLFQTENISESIIGNLLISSSGLFRKYFAENHPVTGDDEECFFNTGLVVSYENGTFKVLGKSKCIISAPRTHGDETEVLVPSSLERDHPFPELSDHFCLHSAMDYIHTKENGIFCGIKAGRVLSLDHLKCFHAFVHKDHDRAIFFHLIKMVDKEGINE